MQNQLVKLFKTNDNILFLFYTGENSIFLKKYINNKWTPPFQIIEGCRNTFNVCGTNGNIYLLCGDNKGNVYACKEKQNGTWEKKIILKGGENTLKSKFFIYAGKSSLSLIYNISEPENSYDSMMFTHFALGQWEKPNKIQNFIKFRDNPYFLNLLEQNHVINFYKDTEQNLCCREFLINPLTIGASYQLLSSGSFTKDISILPYNEKIHVLYFTVTKFSYQLIYRYKANNSISRPVIIWEGQRAESCAVYTAENKIFITWIADGIAYYTCSNDEGHTFMGAYRLNSSVSLYIKGEYLFDGKTCGEIFLDSNYNILFLPEIIENFFPCENINIKAASTNKPQENHVELLKNKINQYEIEIKEKNKILSELSQSLSERTEEIYNLNLNWNKKYNILMQEYESFKKSNITASENNITASEINTVSEESENITTENTEESIEEIENTEKR